MNKSLVAAALLAAIAACSFVLVSSAALTSNPAVSPARLSRAQELAAFREENAWKNSFVMWMFPEAWRDTLPHMAQTWLRNAIMTWTVYFGVGGLWCYYTYHCFGDKLFKAGTIPLAKDLYEQMKVSSKAIPLYALLPTLTEWAVENGWTKAYARIDSVGLPAYVGYFCLYMLSVEFGVYWMHRSLHWGPLYKYLHWDHHKYNKEHTLSPFAGLAFHPIDGILQAIPYTYTLFYCPMHFLTHEILLFATGVWTTNIHDCLHGRVWPIMGAGYHTIHHLNYKTNYGHYFVWFDMLFGTLETPEEFEAAKAAGGKKVKAR